MALKINPDPTMKNNLMAFGWECLEGWYPLIQELIDILVKIDKPDFELLQVKEKYGCYDSETEVLTKDGWKYFYNISKSDKIATLKDGEKIRISKSDRYFRIQL